MKKLLIITRQIIYQDWSYTVEVPDDFVTETLLSNRQQKQYIIDKIRNEEIEGDCHDNDEIYDEVVIDYVRLDQTSQTSNK